VNATIVEGTISPSAEATSCCGLYPFTWGGIDSVIAAAVVDFYSVSLHFDFDRPILAVVFLVFWIVAEGVGRRLIIKGALDPDLDFVLIHISAAAGSRAISRIVSCASMSVEMDNPRASTG
jgi:hypothetical protein